LLQQGSLARAVILIWQLMDRDAFRLNVHNSIHAIGSADWNRFAGRENPFIQYDFLSALEDGGAVGGTSGWNIAHLALQDTNEKLLGVAPHYLKQHSYGEYIFDHSWANAFERAAPYLLPQQPARVCWSKMKMPHLRPPWRAALHHLPNKISYLQVISIFCLPKT
jgi:predicted N-acyltransferase